MKKATIISLITGCCFTLSFSQENNPPKTDSITIQKQLDETIITASRIKSPLKNTPEVIQVITAEEIKSMNAGSVSDILQYASGVGISTGTGSGLPKRGVVSINGFPGNYSLVLIDGARFVSDHLQTGQNIELLPVENIERIEIIKGAYSAQYGSDALGGIVNIITKKCADKPAMNFHASGGSYNTYNTNLMSHVPFTEKQKLSSFISWEQSDGIPLIAPVHRVGSMYYDNLITQNRFDIISGNNLSMHISAGYLKNKMLFKGEEKNSWLFLPDAGMDWKVNDKLALRPVVHYVYWKSDQNAEDITLFNPEITAQYTVNNKNILLAGVDYKDNSYTRTSVAKHIINSTGAFAQYRMGLSDKFDLATALRFDDVQGNESVLSPSLSLMYKPMAKIRLRASTGRGFHAPSVQELYEIGYGHGGTAYRFGNPDLKPEYSTSSSLSTEYIHNNLHVIVNGFYSVIKDMIVPSYGGPWSVDTTKDMWVRQNIHSAKIYGGEITAVYEFIKGYNLSVGYTYTDNLNEKTGKQLPYSPGTIFNCKLDVKQKINNQVTLAFFAAINAAYNRKAWNWKPAAGALRYDESGLITALKNYQQVEAGISLICSEKYKFSFNVYNILGQDIEYLEDAYTQIEGEPYFKIGFNYSFR